MRYLHWALLYFTVQLYFIITRVRRLSRGIIGRRGSRGRRGRRGIRLIRGIRGIRKKKNKKGPVVKWLRHNFFNVVTRVRFPSGLLIKS